MKILKVLEPLEKLETRTADLYEYFGKILSDDREAASLFFRMSVDEVMHANIVRYQRRLVSKNPKMFCDACIDYTAYHELTTILERIDSFEKDNPVPSLEEALSFALELENGAAEYHCKAAIVAAEPDLLPFFNNLSSFDTVHFQELVRFAGSRGFSFQIRKEEASSALPGGLGIRR